MQQFTFQLSLWARRDGKQHGTGSYVWVAKTHQVVWMFNGGSKICTEDAFVVVKWVDTIFSIVLL